MGYWEKGVELPIAVVDEQIAPDEELGNYGASMSVLMDEIEKYLNIQTFVHGSDVSVLEGLVEEKLKGHFLMSLSDGGTDKEGKLYLKGGNGTNNLYFPVGKRVQDANTGTISYQYDSTFQTNFIDKLQKLVAEKKKKFDLVDEDTESALAVLQEELLDTKVVEGFLERKFGEREKATDPNAKTLIQKQIQYTLDLLSSRTDQPSKALLTQRNPKLATMQGTEQTSENKQQTNELIVQPTSDEKDAKNPNKAQTIGYDDVYGTQDTQQAETDISNGQSTDAVAIDTQNNQDQAENNVDFKDELKKLNNEFPQLTVEQKKQVAGLPGYVLTDPVLFQTTMAAIYGNEHHTRYLEKYFSLMEKYNTGEISKIKADILALKAERELNKKDQGTVREARMDVKQAGKTLRRNEKIEKNVKKMLRCVIQAEASERRTKMMLDIAAKIKAGNVGSNQLPLPNMNYGEVAYFPQTPNSSLLWSSLSDLGYTSLDQLPPELFAGIDMQLFPELQAGTPYRMQLEGYLNPDLKHQVAGQLEADSRVTRNMESFSDDQLMDFFGRIVKSKEENDKEEYPDGWKPVFQEIAKRYLSQNMDVLGLMDKLIDAKGNKYDEGKKKELLEMSLFSLVDERVIADMHQRRRVDVPGNDDYDEQTKHHILGNIFVRSLMQVYGNSHVSTTSVKEKNKITGFGKRDEERIKTKLATAFGGSWNAITVNGADNKKVSYTGNETLGSIIEEHVANLPRKPYDDIINGGAGWLEKQLGAGDFLTTANGNWGGGNRAVDMAIIGGLTSIGVSPENAAASAGAIKLLGGGIVAFVAIKGWYDNFWKGQSTTNVIWKNALLSALLFLLPRALTNKSLDQLFDFAVNGDRAGTGLLPGALIKKFSKEVSNKTNPDAFQAEFMTGLAFGPMTLESLGKYLTYADGRYKLEGAKLKAFFNAPDVPKESKEWISNILSVCNNSESKLSVYLHQGLERSGLNPDGSNFVEYTTTSPYKEKTFNDLKRDHMEIEMLTDMFDGIIGDDATKFELSKWYTGLSEEEKTKAAERVAEVKKFQTIWKETTPYMQFLLQRQELWPAPTGSVLEGMDDAKAQAIAGGLASYKTNKGKLAKSFIMDEQATSGTFKDLFGAECGAGRDVVDKIYADGGLAKLKAYEKVVGTNKSTEKLVCDYEKERMCGKYNEEDIPVQTNHLILQKIPGFNEDVMLEMKAVGQRTILSFWIKDTQGVRQEYQFEKLHETLVNGPALGMNYAANESLQFQMQLPSGPNGAAQIDTFSPEFFPGICTNLKNGDTEFRVPEERLSDNTQPTWLWNKQATGIRDRVDVDLPSKLLGPKMKFIKTGKTMP